MQKSSLPKYYKESGHLGREYESLTPAAWAGSRGEKNPSKFWSQMYYGFIDD